MKSSGVVPLWRESQTMSRKPSEVLYPLSSNTYDQPVIFRYHENLNIISTSEKEMEKVFFYFLFLKYFCKEHVDGGL